MDAGAGHSHASADKYCSFPWTWLVGIAPPDLETKPKSMKNTRVEEFPFGTADYGFAIVTAVAWVAAVAWVRSLAQELPHAMGAAKTKPKAKHRSGVRRPAWAPVLPKRNEIPDSTQVPEKGTASYPLRPPSTPPHPSPPPPMHPAPSALPRAPPVSFPPPTDSQENAEAVGPSFPSQALQTPKPSLPGQRLRLLCTPPLPAS